MSHKLSFLAIVPARCGSKGLPHKNILLLHGKPLIAWTIEAALKSRYITETVVSSDCEEILSVAKKFGATIVKRPKELALDTSPSEPLIVHAIEELKRHGKYYDYIVLLQPTSPMRDHEDIDNAIKNMLHKQATASISVYEPSHSPFKAFVENKDGFLTGIVDNQKPFTRRQNLPNAYLSNGAIYIVSTKKFMKNKKLITDKTVPYVMSREKSIDIDTEQDFRKVEAIIKKREYNITKIKSPLPDTAG